MLPSNWWAEVLMNAGKMQKKKSLWSVLREEKEEQYLGVERKSDNDSTDSADHQRVEYHWGQGHRI